MNDYNNDDFVYSSKRYYSTNAFPYNNGMYGEPKRRIKFNKWFLIVPLIVIFIAIAFFFIINLDFGRVGKERTFMIYMVGSDLESKSKQGTYSISDMVGEKIDLVNNNVVLLAGGAEKWHNFVNPEEIGIYELTINGFERKGQLPLDSMGSSSTLEAFLKYSYENYPAGKYDMIFWNHGLGSIGIEQDELSKDFMTLSELDSAFSNSIFAKEKLELTIFYNCLAGNIHIANIMKNYSNYMVASEEIFYLSKVLTRLSFLEKIKPDFSAYDIGYAFIEQSDDVVDAYNLTHTKVIDSTLSIIDLSKINSLYDKLNEFIDNINISQRYYTISSLRRNMHTYGKAQTYDYDTVDLKELVEALSALTSDKSLSQDVLEELDNTVLYSSSLNNHSNGLSIYFPYFGSKTAIETHLNLFKKIDNNNYYKFINEFHDLKTGTIKKNRDSSNTGYNKLTNEVVNDGTSITIKLTEKEKEKYQSASIYLFKKVDDKYQLIMESDKVNINNNVLTYNNKKVLKVNNDIISAIDKDDLTSYGKLADKYDTLDTIFYYGDNNKIDKVLLDSDKYISSSLVEYDDYDEVYFSKIYYKLFDNNEFDEYFKDSKTKEDKKYNKKDLKITLDNNNEEYYVLFEMYDINNDTYYSKVTKIDA